MEKPVIHQERLAKCFVDLVRIDSVSKEEAGLCRHLRAELDDLGVETLVDDAGVAVGGDSGNLIGRFKGTRPAEPLLLSAHMDTVEPGRGVVPVFREGVFFSNGETILGADDKCGLAIIIEALRAVRDKGLPCPPLELVFTICEEIGLQGAKHLAYDRLTARRGYVLDTRNPEVIIVRAPAANRLTFTIEGVAAHAGAEPQKGINAIALAAKAIAPLKLGRLDDETTCNIGLISGGVATNIVPAKVVVHGEVRSHDRTRLEDVTRRIVASFQQVVDDEAALGRANGTPALHADVQSDFEVLSVREDHTVVTMARKAAARLNRNIYTATSGGGSDANVFAQHGIVTGVLGTGCEKVHTVEERVALEDMVRAAQLLVEILRVYAENVAAG